MKLLFIIFALQLFNPITRLRDGKVELLNENGSVIRTIYSGNISAIDSDINSSGSLIVVTLSNGSVELRNSTGGHIRTLYNVVMNKALATKSKFSGTEILIYLDNGKTELIKENGSVIRTF